MCRLRFCECVHGEERALTAATTAKITGRIWPNNTNWNVLYTWVKIRARRVSTEKEPEARKRERERESEKETEEREKETEESEKESERGRERAIESDRESERETFCSWPTSPLLNSTKARGRTRSRASTSYPSAEPMLTVGLARGALAVIHPEPCTP